MKVKKLIVPLTLFISFIVALSGCTTETPPRVERQQPYPYDDDFVCGYFLTFRDDDNPD